MFLFEKFKGEFSAQNIWGGGGSVKCDPTPSEYASESRGKSGLGDFPGRSPFFDILFSDSNAQDYKDKLSIGAGVLIKKKKERLMKVIFLKVYL